MTTTRLEVWETGQSASKTPTSPGGPSTTSPARSRHCSSEVRDGAPTGLGGPSRRREGGSDADRVPDGLGLEERAHAPEVRLGGPVRLAAVGSATAAARA